MANKVEILNLDINTSALITKMGETRAEIQKLQAAQKELTTSNQTTSEAFTKNQVELARLQSSYNAQKSVVTQLKTAQDSFATATAAVTSAIEKENTSIAEARANNTQLLALRNQINIKTAEGQAALASINGKLDQNNAFIKENVSGYEKQKIGIGDYSRAITESVQALGYQGAELRNVKALLEKSSGIWSALKGEVKAGADQIKNSAAATDGMSTAQKALSIATGVGTGAMRIFAVALAATGIGLITAAIALLIGYFKTFDPLVDKLEQAMAGFGAAVRVVQRTLGDFLTGITSVGDAFTKLGNFIAHPIDSLKKLGNEMNKAASEAAKLKEAQQELADAQAIQEVSNAKALQQYAELILKSKNRTLSEQERIAALKQAEAIETKNFKERTDLANKDLAQSVEAARIKGGLLDNEVKNLERLGTAYAINLLNRGKITQEEVDAIQKAELAKIAIQDESTKRLEKNQNAQDKLNEDAQAAREKAAQKAREAAKKEADERAKIIDAAIQKTKSEIDIYIQSQGIRKKSLSDELDFEESVMQKRLELLKQEFEAKKKTEEAYQAESLQLKNDFAKKQVDLVIANADAELKAFLATNKTLIDKNKFANDELVAQELDRLNRVSEAEAANATTRLENGTINEEQYQAAIKAIDDTYEANKQAVLEEKQIADAEKAAIDLENKAIATESEFQLQLSNLERKRQNEVAAATKTGADVSLINAKFSKAEIEMKRTQENSKLQMISGTLETAKGLFKENTVAYKAIAIAQATINTYQAATQAYLAGLSVGGPTGLVLGPVMAGVAIAAGVANVAKIAGVKFADGGQVPKLSDGVINNGSNIIPQSNGDDTLAYVKQGEVILNKRQQAAAGGKMFFRSIGVPGFAGGGLVGGNSNLGSQGGQKIDIDLLADKIAQANSQLPSPVVSVVDIAAETNRVSVIESGANF
jgi:hypothetical protein